MASLGEKKYIPEEYLLNTLNDLDIGFVKVSNDGTIINHNLTFNKIFGYSPKKNLVSTKILDYWLNSEDRNKFREVLYKKGTVKKYVTLVKKVDGEKIFLELNFKLNKNSKGDTISSEGTFIDITERKKGEEKILEEKNRAQSYLNLAGVILLALDKSGNISMVNKKGYEVLGFSEEELIGKNWFLTCLPPRLRESVLVDFKRLIVGELEPIEFYENPIITKIGEERIIAWHNSLLFDKEGIIVGTLSSGEDITKIKEAEENLKQLNKDLEHRIEKRTKELKESEEILRASLDSTADGILVVNDEGHVTHTNSKFANMWRIPQELINEKDDQKLLDYVLNQLKDPQAFLSKVEQLYRSASDDFDTLYFKDGRIFERFSSPLVLEAEIKGRVWSFRDITKRKKSDEALKESERRLKEAQALGKIGYWEFDVINQHITWSDQVFKIYDRDPSLGPPSVEEEATYYTPDTSERLQKYASRALEYGEEFDYDFEANLPNGMVVQLAALMRSIKNNEEKIIKLVGTVQDITERKKKEKEIFDLAQFPSEDPYPILRVNRDGIMYINVAGQKLLNVVDSDQIPEIFQESVKNTFESNQSSESEVELDNRVYSFTITPIKGADYVNIYGMDITERKHVEKNLKEINKLKSEFLRRASHELKTPLIAIKGFSDLILTLYQEELNLDIISKLGEITQGCERLQNIISDLIFASRLESSELEPKFEREDLSFLIRYCVDELHSIAAEREHSINMELPNPLIARFEKEEIHDVITNLLTNAIKYTPPKGWIDIKIETLDDFIVVSIKDNGIGFTKEEEDRIFQQFGKIERYGQGLDLGIDGSGLGLYISKKIVESHGGKIWMESEGKHKGSTFYFSLPIAK